MNYEKIYINLIMSREFLDRSKKHGHFEKHHIFPKCFGGTNDKENLVLLTPKEHYIAHLLLTKCYLGRMQQQMNFAFWVMSNRKRYKNMIS